MHTTNQPPRLLGEHPVFLNLLRAANLVAVTDASVLISGESGTGKELLARYVHQHSRRANQAFISLNCAALPEPLAESELFGHRKGAFTGAHQTHDGKVQAAHQGTLFLDEIGELSLPIQAKLLRFLESGECQRLGQVQAEHYDVRVIAATNRDLQAAVQTQTFRADLFYRLHVVPLHLPPLRERRSDIPLLLNALTQHLSQQHDLPCPHYQTDALQVLQTYAWPGNVRELRNVCERLLILCSGHDINTTQLPLEIRGHQVAPHHLGVTLPDEGIRLDELEVALLQQALDKTAGNQSRAAALLGLTRDTFLYRLKKYALK